MALVPLALVEYRRRAMEQTLLYFSAAALRCTQNTHQYLSTVLGPTFSLIFTRYEHAT
jgi:hypothetical protein